MDAFDDEVRRRLTGAARELEQSPEARMAPGTIARAVRRHRIGIARRVAAGALALGVVAVAGPLMSPSDTAGLQPAGRPTGSHGVPTATAPGTGAPTSRPSTPPRGTAAATGKPAAQPSVQPARPGAPTVGAPEPPARPVCGGSVAPDRAKPSGVEVTLETSATSPRQGGTVRLTVRVRNTGLVPVRYTSSGQEYDFWAYDAKGRVWQWSLGQAFTQPLNERTLAPGQEHVESVDWTLTGCGNGAPPPPLAAGRYTVRALWISDAESWAGWWSDPVDIVIR